MSFVRQLGYALYDESMDVQFAVVKVIGKNLTLNPMYLNPLLMKKLLELMKEIRHHTDVDKKHQLFSILESVVGVANGVKPHVDSFLDALSPMLRVDHGEKTASSVLSVMAALADVDQHSEKLHKLLPEVFKVATQLLSREDDTSETTITTLHSLVRLVESTGIVMQPYSMVPELMPTLLGFITSSKHPQPVRVEAGRLLGSIGAICPFKLGRMLQGQSWHNTRTKRSFE